MSPQLLARRIKSLAAEIGFDLCGITDTRPLAHADDYKTWLAAGYAGDMLYLHRHVERRANPEQQLPGARSVICLAVNYHRPDETAPGPDRCDGPQAPAAFLPQPGAPAGRIAQYARGRDYHDVLRAMLNSLLERLRLLCDVAFESRVCVDTSPLLERELAARAGLGWLGKNTLLIHPRLGSYLLLGEILTTLELPTDSPVPDHCGSCTRCLEACPTSAFPQPHQLDATRCIAYLTIESRREVPAELQPAIGDWVFGCDVCQDVCPHNGAAPFGAQPELRATRLPARIDLGALRTIRTGTYLRLTAGTAARRATRRMWARNAGIAWRNQTAPPAQPAASSRQPPVKR